MKKIFLSAVTVLLVFSACNLGSGQQPKIDPNKVVQQGMVNLSEIKSATYELNLGGNFASAEDKDVNFDVDANGGYDNADPMNPKFSLVINANVQEGENIIDANAELRLIEKAFYFMLAGLEGEGDLPLEAIEPYLNQWWTIPLPEDYMAGFNFMNSNEENMTPEEKQLLELFKKTEFFKDITFVKNEKIDGVNTHRYKVNLNKEALINYFVESTKVTVEGGMSEEELQEFRAIWEKIDFSGDIWVAEENMTFKKLEGVIDITDLEGATAKIKVGYKVDKLGEAVEVAKPEDAFEFDPFAMMGV